MNYLFLLLILVRSILEEREIKEYLHGTRRNHVRILYPHLLCSDIQCLTSDTGISTKVTFIVPKELFQSQNIV